MTVSLQFLWSFLFGFSSVVLFLEGFYLMVLVCVYFAVRYVNNGRKILLNNLNEENAAK